MAKKTKVIPRVTIAETLKQRGGRYGEFIDHARVAQQLQDVMRAHVNSKGQIGWNNLSPTQKQALTVIMDKVARMLNGDPTYHDNPFDIQGYAAKMCEELTP